ncbi:SdpI family protein [Flavobacterium sp. ACAM 123]|uniref:SdpI family protein n=1 Tax=Flavobacterium sp. ACAM 123 TaxID=1189620 RepID=UPI00036AFBCF|nr:SdpI family protein [Flavobacterium sp. ACAM 123]
MTLVISILLIFAIILKLFTPKKPNYLLGYQLGSAKKSVEHWKIANRYAANYMIIIYTLALVISLIFNYRKYDGEIWILTTLVIGFILMYVDIEKRLKKID